MKSRLRNVLVVLRLAAPFVSQADTALPGSCILQLNDVLQMAMGANDPNAPLCTLSNSGIELGITDATLTKTDDKGNQTYGVKFQVIVGTGSIGNGTATVFAFPNNQGCNIFGFNLESGA